MTVSVTWPTRVIFVPKADTVLTGTDPLTGRELRTYDTDTLRRELRDLEDDQVGRAFPRTHDYDQSFVLGGVTYAPVLTFVNDYQIEFEDGQYRVVLEGSNNNAADVAVVNQVQIVPTNAAGQVVTGSGLSVGQDQTLSLIKDLLEADETHTAAAIIKYLKGTNTELLNKAVTGSQLPGTLTIVDSP
jgi:hypothetical protein